MEKLLVGHEVEKMLGVSKKTLATLSAAGFLHPQTVGTANVYNLKEVAALKEISKNLISEDSPPAWIVRLGPPRREDPLPGQAIGHPLGWEIGREDNVDAARMYWRITHAEKCVDHALVALVGPLVVGVWNIVRGIFHEDIPPYGRTEFVVEDARPDQKEAFEGRWLNLGRGSSVLRWPRPE